MNFISTKPELQPSDKYKLLKVFVNTSYTSFDTPKMNKVTTSSKVISFEEFNDYSDYLNNSCDGEITNKIVLVYDLFDNEPYSIKWLEGS